MNTEDPTYWEPRDCLRVPTSHVWRAVDLLDKAADAHVSGSRSEAATLIADADTPEIRDYVETMWGSAKNYPDQVHYLRRRHVESLPESLPKAKERMPGAATKRLLIARDGYRCRFCGVPVIPMEVRKSVHLEYPNALRWGSKNAEQHAAFQCLWLQFDHVIPFKHGGDSSMENVVITCAPCNFAKNDYHLRELGLTDPRERAPIPSEWDGLMRVLAH
ncbi:HNH endonuclease [Jannaschia sp. M317]|uniref:HNH endonuclease n=1 Tax=Jannaschia sp. M317 TaxID=2867011 RepID=UPI0021A8E011|nr:HNH endonuclease signature motif containing protein [Jannaschia sp. M317]UWQ19232.1 HNH endonuclease [Jannaschia sp. M317]